MRLTKRQLKRIIREEYSRLKRRGLIRESVSCPDPAECERIVEDNDFFLMDPDVHAALKRADGADHFATMMSYNEDYRDSLRDVDHDCDMMGWSTHAFLKWVAGTKAGSSLDRWYGGDNWERTSSIMDEMPNRS